MFLRQTLTGSIRLNATGPFNWQNYTFLLPDVTCGDIKSVFFSIVVVFNRTPLFLLLVC